MQNQTKQELQVFVFPVTNQSVRVIEIDGEPWFVATDVCRELGYVNSPDAIARHCKKDGIAKRDTVDKLGRRQEVTVIDERNLYRLMGRSDAPNAEPFQDWVYGEVLPSIRKTGSYSIQPLSAAELLLQQAQLMVNHERRQQELERNQQVLEAKVHQVDQAIDEIRHEIYAHTGYVSLKGFCHQRHISAPLYHVNQWGKAAARLAAEAGIVLGKVPDERWGSVNSYPVSFLEENWGDITANYPL